MNIKIKTRVIDHIKSSSDVHGPTMEIQSFMLIPDMKATIKEFLKVVPAQTWDEWCREFNEEVGE